MVYRVIKLVIGDVHTFDYDVSRQRHKKNNYIHSRYMNTCMYRYHIDKTTFNYVCTGRYPMLFKWAKTIKCTGKAS